MQQLLMWLYGSRKQRTSKQVFLHFQFFFLFWTWTLAEAFHKSRSIAYAAQDKKLFCFSVSAFFRCCSTARLNGKKLKQWKGGHCSKWLCHCNSSVQFVYSMHNPLSAIPISKKSIYKAQSAVQLRASVIDCIVHGTFTGIAPSRSLCSSKGWAY